MSSTTASNPVVAAFRAATAMLAELPVWQLSSVDVADLCADLETERRRFDYGLLRVLADLDKRNVAEEQAGIPTIEFLRQRLRLSPSEAKSRIRAAAELIESEAPSGERIPAILPDTAAGVADGALSLEHVRVISRAVEKLPSGLDFETRSEVETQLASHAHTLDPAALTVAARRVHTNLDPDGVLDEDKPARRELAFVRDVGGCDLVRGRLDVEGAAIVRTAIDAISTPDPQDTKSPARRRADGLIELCQRYLDSGQLPAQGGEKPHVTVTMHLTDLTATLGTGQPITAEAARRLACDATVIPAVLGTTGEPLDVGRATRTIPPAIRRALVLRDKGCIHPGCPRPAAWCDAHHVRHWIAGGPTALTKLLLRYSVPSCYDRVKISTAHATGGIDAQATACRRAGAPDRARISTRLGRQIRSRKVADRTARRQRAIPGTIRISARPAI